jgi:hypothetical protein
MHDTGLRHVQGDRICCSSPDTLHEVLLRRSPDMIISGMDGLRAHL